MMMLSDPGRLNSNLDCLTSAAHEYSAFGFAAAAALDASSVAEACERPSPEMGTNRIGLEMDLMANT